MSSLVRWRTVCPEISPPLAGSLKPHPSDPFSAWEVVPEEPRHGPSAEDGMLREAALAFLGPSGFRWRFQVSFATMTLAADITRGSTTFLFAACIYKGLKGRLSATRPLARCPKPPLFTSLPL